MSMEITNLHVEWHRRVTPLTGEPQLGSYPNDNTIEGRLQPFIRLTYNGRHYAFLVTDPTLKHDYVMVKIHAYCRLNTTLPTGIRDISDPIQQHHEDRISRLENVIFGATKEPAKCMIYDRLPPIAQLDIRLKKLEALPFSRDDLIELIQSLLPTKQKHKTKKVKSKIKSKKRKR